GCAPDERESLIAASRLLDSRMRELRGSHRMAGIDRIAVLAALNLAHELTQVRTEAEQHDKTMERLLAELNRSLSALSTGAADSSAL
ncbi:MAG: cell division protein ZapA, partial [Gammaproteobacteria bacterium HGW-Gammaproteobacteria-7]